MADAKAAGRANQRSRTRKDLLAAANRLLQAGGNPTLDDVAAEAMVSRATAYRYFSGIEDLLVEAALDVAMPDETLFAGDDDGDAIERLLRADAAVAEMIRVNERALRTMLIHSLQRGLAGDGALPNRQNRRTPLIESALAPVRDAMDPARHRQLVRALALVIGTEARIAFKDVLQLEDPAANSVRDWMIRSLVQAALQD
jgi:AcrR family transcriptional regulator